MTPPTGPPAAPPAAAVDALAALRRHGRGLRGRRTALVAGACVLALVLVVSLLTAVFGPATTGQDLLQRLAAPSWWPGGSPGHLLGTDSLGRDVFARIAEGARTSLLIGLAAVAIAVVFGVAVGLLAGFAGGWVDAAFMRLADAVLAIPTVLLALSVIAVVGGGIRNLVLVIAFSQWMTFARNTRAVTLVQREKLYTTAARAAGAGNARIVLRHVLPHTLPSTIVLATLNVSSAILVEAGLSFLGIGVQPPAPSLGGMLSEGRQYVTGAPWLALFPGLAIFVLVLAVNVLGDGLRSHLDRERP
ncbi:ABC transporter permease [Kineococcus sp. SYSU DK003]|uniref:ABC transporter permease n=1 Tax=Kineococcus sp. SYSU DK003 TaxID=3383124 RepID=UPI003D7DFD0F